jgi:DinB superfamily
MPLAGPPKPNEYDLHYEPYVARVSEHDLVSGLESQFPVTVAFLSSIPESRIDHRYAPGKWTIREVLGHVVDMERVFGFRALVFARGERAPIPGADENDYVRVGGFSSVPFTGLIKEYEHLRRSHILLFNHFSPEAWSRTGTANDAQISVRALGYVMLGHERHHLEVLRTKYHG